MTITSQFSISMKLLPPLYISHALDDLISNCCWNRPWLVKYSQQPKSLVWCPPFSKHGTRYIFGNLTEHTGADRKWFFLQRWFVRSARRRGSWERWSTRTPGKLAAPTTQLQGRRGEVERWNQSIFIIGIGHQFWVSCKNRWVKTSCWLRGKIASTLLTRTSKSAEFASRRYSMCSQTLWFNLSARKNPLVSWNLLLRCTCFSSDLLKLVSPQVHQVNSHYCQECAYKKGICAMCGHKIIDTSKYRQSSVWSIILLNIARSHWKSLAWLARVGKRAKYFVRWSSWDLNNVWKYTVPGNCIWTSWKTCLMCLLKNWINDLKWPKPLLEIPRGLSLLNPL